MALGDKARKLSSEAGRGLGEVAGKTKAGVVDIAKASSDSLREQLGDAATKLRPAPRERSEEHTSELQSLMRISYAVFCLKKKKKKDNEKNQQLQDKHTT